MSGSHNSRHYAHTATFAQVLLLILDIPFIVMSLVMAATVWRAPNLIKRLIEVRTKRQPAAQDEENQNVEPRIMNDAEMIDEGSYIVGYRLVS